MSVPACLSTLFASLKFRLTAIAVLVLALGIGLITVQLTQHAERDLLQMQRQRELDGVVRSAAVLSRRCVELQRALRASASLLDEATLADPQRLASALHATPALRELFSYVFVADANGKVLLVADSQGLRHPQVWIGDRDYFQTAITQARPAISEPLPDRVLGQPVVALVHPLTDIGSGRVHGVIGGAMKLASRELLSDLVESTNGNAGDTGATVIVTDANGRILAHPEPRRLLGQLREEPGLREATEAWWASGAPVEPSGLSLPQAGQMVSNAGVPGPDWVVWRLLPEEALLAPLHQARREALQWAGALVLLLGACLLLVVAWLLRPLTLLRRRALRLFEPGDHAAGDWPALNGEIGQLSQVLRQVSTAREQVEHLNREVLVKLRSVMNASPLGIAVSRDGKAEMVSDEFCQLFGRPREALLGSTPEIVFGAEPDWQRARAESEAAFRNGQRYQGDWQLRRADGSLFWARLHGRLVDEHQLRAGTVWTVSDISSEVAEREQLAWSASHDLLTGLANRRAFLQRANRLLAERPASVAAALLVIDLDRFKPINDTAGHAAGDAMLKAVAAAIGQQVRGSDLVVRLGGDEFGVLLPSCPPEAAQRVAGHIREAVDSIVLPWGVQKLRVGASLGLAMLDSDTLDTADWLHQADIACYADKAERKREDRQDREVADLPPPPTLRIVGKG